MIFYYKKEFLTDENMPINDNLFRGLGVFETIKFTVEGYLNDLSNNSALENRLETINQYSKKAAKLELPWTK